LVERGNRLLALDRGELAEKLVERIATLEIIE